MQGIIVLVGFLGAGKTTLLKRLVDDYLARGWEPFVVLNDYQNANIDAQQFLDDLPSSQVNALHGSCICCSGIKELRDCVNSIPSKKDSVVLIEANGTTDACSLMGFLGVGLKEHFLPPIQISIVDVQHWQKRGQDNELEANQIQVSSLVILNHWDKVSNERLKAVSDEISKLNPAAQIEKWDDLDSSILTKLNPSQNEAGKIDHIKAHWSSCSVDLPDPFPSKKLKDLMRTIPDSILRIKGCTKLDLDKHYTYFERLPSGETTFRQFNGKLISGPKLLTIGPGSNPESILRLLNNS